MNRYGIKKFLALFLALTMLTSVVPTAVFATGEDSPVTEATEYVAEISEDTSLDTTVSEDIASSEAVVEESEAAVEETESVTEATEDVTEETEPTTEETEVVEETEPATEEPEEATKSEKEETIQFGEDLQVTVNSELLMSADATSATGVKVAVTGSQMVIKINRVGTQGTAELYRFEANKYFKTDSLSGLSKFDNASGEYICDYECGTEQTVKFNRYQTDGTDNLYYKYYLIQDGKILAGPYYATDIASMRSKAPFNTGTKKGLALEDGGTIEYAKEMGVGSTAINMDMCTLIVAKEDEDGNPIDLSGRSDLIEFESNGEIFYFNADYVRAQDSLIVPYSKAGINVSLIVISWAKTWTKDYPTSLMYLTAKQNRHTMAFNTSTERGRDYWIAAMEFLSDRYSKSANSGLVSKYIISNEIDYTYDWNLIIPLQDANGNYQRADFDVFMEEYARTMRLADLAVKKYNSKAKVQVSLTHNWAVNCHDSYNYSSAIRKNSYAPKDILDWLCRTDAARGNYDWGIAQHPYAIGTTSSNPVKTDPMGSASGSAKPITGDVNTSPWVTVANLEILQLYLEQPYTQYNGQIRTVSLSEASVCHSLESSLTDEEYLTATYEQAASIAMMYYRAAHLSCIDEVIYFMLHDSTNVLEYGFMTGDEEIKPSYNVWKYVDTNKSFNYSNRYLKYIAPDAESYLDVMTAVESKFDWESEWDTSKIMTKTISTEEVERSIASDKTSYGANEAILVTATGDVGDMVGLYLASDNLEKAEAIYSYPVSGSNGNVAFKSGSTYELITYGETGLSRVGDAALKAGKYKLVLTRGDTGEMISTDITITAPYVYGSTELTVKTDKTTYTVGENIVVTATGNSKTWVGLYGKNDTYGTGHVTSIYWYYVNDPDGNQLSGKPTILQTGIHNTDSSNPASRIAPGEYVLYLFDGSNGNDYNAVKSLPITIVPAEMNPLTSITYKLDNETDGMAGGTVVVTKDASNEGATDCVMYWADENGKPLEGYTALAMFKLEGAKTTHKMLTHTIIPEGAKKLIAYASDGSSLSETAVSVDLPMNSDYHFTGNVLAEFQSVTDVHVTTDKGAGGEVKLANQHFVQMLEDVKANSKDSIGIFISGDIANTGSEAEYLKVYNLYQTEANEGDGKLPKLHMSIGNHDWMAGNPNDQFQRYAKIYNSNLKQQPENVYYDEVVGGYHFVYLGGEQAGLRAYLTTAQLDWFDKRMEEITEEDPNKPVFVFLHQSFYNTVSGSLPGEGWDGVANEMALKRILKKYGQIILVNGHSHWQLDSDSCMYPGDNELPVTLNAASVGYLWSGYNILGGEFADGSQGFYVRVYEDKVVYLGRDFENGLWVPSAIFVIQRNNIQTSADVYSIEVGGDALNIGATPSVPTEIAYQSSNTEIASVAEDGTIIAKREGEVEITIVAAPTDTTVITKKTVTVKIGDASVYRIYGDNRFETAMEIADAAKGFKGVDKFDAAIIACGTDFADALSGSYLAYVKDAPILIAYDKNADEVRSFIAQNLNEGGTVYLLGGKNVLTDKVAIGLNNCTVKRVWGHNRFLTNLEILKEANVTGNEILVCTGLNYADSLSASATKKPILLVSDKLMDEQKEYLASLSGCTFTIIGGENAVSKDVEVELSKYGKVERIGGKDRCETSVLIAERYFDNPDNAVLAYALNYPDGLCSGPMAMTIDAPLLLVCEGYEGYATNYLKKNGVNSGMAIGGIKLISDNLVKKVFGLDNDATITVW